MREKVPGNSADLVDHLKETAIRMNRFYAEHPEVLPVSLPPAPVYLVWMNGTIQTVVGIFSTIDRAELAVAKAMCVPALRGQTWERESPMRWTCGAVNLEIERREVV